MKPNVKGRVLYASDADFKQAAYDVWNRLVPQRRPEMIVQVHDEQDVIETIRFARANRLKVAVRGGGHNWCHPSLRNSGIMIDLTAMNQVISIDADTKKAVLQPVISNREAQAELNKHGLAYPTGHCPQVKLSGYLLGGGMSWNQGVGSGHIERRGHGDGHRQW